MLRDVKSQRPGAIRAGSKESERYLQARKPFDSPNLSTSSLNETDDGSTSGQDEFHLERYSSNAKYRHLRDISRSSSKEEKAKPDLNIITDFSVPKMPMEAQDVVVCEVPAKQVRADRRNKAFSVVSQKAVQSAVSPPDEARQPVPSLTPGLKKLKLSTMGSRKEKPIRRLHEATLQRKTSPFTQRVPFGITISKEDAAAVEQNMDDSALPTITPMTPAIVVTPAGDQKPWVLQNNNADQFRRPASSIYSAMPAEKPMIDVSKMPSLPRGADQNHSEKALRQQRRNSYGSSEMILPDSADSARPKSQGWWNLMLSPLLRAGSLASRKGKQVMDTPPVPPLPFFAEKHDSPALSARSDPSFLMSSTGTSPETPRRQGLASTPASTWSRWTEWELEREANAQNGVGASENEKDDVQVLEPENLVPAATTIPGLGAEYFHACAVEQVTGRAYFECINHSCAEQLPILCSVYDEPAAKGVFLASPFESPLVQTRKLESEDNMSPHNKNENSSPTGLSPNVRKASIAAVVRAKALDGAENKDDAKRSISSVFEEKQDKATTRDRTQTMTASDTLSTSTLKAAPAAQIVEVIVTDKRAAPVLSLDASSEKAPLATATQIASPGPISPEGQKAVAPMDSIPLSDVNQKPGTYGAPLTINNYAQHEQLPGRPAFITADTEFPDLPPRVFNAPLTASDLQPRRLSIEERRQRHEREDAAAKKVGGLWRGRGCFPKNGCMGRGGPEQRTKRRWVIGISILLLAIIMTSIILAVTLTRRGDNTPVESQWLNLTGFPAMPIGILTIATPNLVAFENQCTGPTTAWSCAVPKDDRDEIGANEPNQPNLRFEIKFRNGTVPANMTIPLGGSGFSDTSKDPFTNDLFVANPPAPNQPDQIFLGQTTDNITAPFDGEKTPFYITFMSSFPQIPANFNTSDSRRLLRRQSNETFEIPAPALASDGSAAPASLLPTTPYPISQPVRLYNRGLQDEHYGFYTYYDKSTYLSGLRIEDGTPTSGSNDPVEADQDGGSLKSEANAVCTFAQTRFMFKAYTNPAFGVSLLSSLINPNLTAPEDHKKHNKTSSATNFERPGSFPYPTSFVVDRHGGDIDTKAIYCYGMQNGNIVKSEKFQSAELRSFGGQSINPAPAVLDDQNDFNKTAGGIDGGTGGCFCNWQNWQ